MILPFSLLALGSVVAAVNFDWNCQNSLGPCNNACFRVNCRGSPLPFTYDSNTANRDPRRTRSGCNKTPCTKTGYKKYGNSCDEFPFASVTQGGTGATLRCVDSTENSSMYTTSPKTSPSHKLMAVIRDKGEGGQLGNFYKTIKNGDKFGIVLRNYGGA